jgi:hypothetical protein
MFLDWSTAGRVIGIIVTVAANIVVLYYYRRFKNKINKDQ